MNTNSRQIAARFHYRGLDIPRLLQIWAQERGSHRFLIWEPLSAAGRSWTYAEFWNDVRRLAGGLYARGIVTGDRVLIHSDNCPEMVIAWYACATLGAIAVTTNTGSVGSELAHAALHAEVKAAITQPRYARLVAEHAGPIEWMAVTRENSGEEAAGADIGSGAIPFEGLFGSAEHLPQREPDPLLPSGIVFTSGTTARPKAVLHSHANLIWAGQAGPYVSGFGPDDVHFAQMPFFHINSQYWSIATALGVGGAAVLLSKPTVSRFWDVVAKHGVTHMSLMPHIQRSLASAEIPPGQRMKVFNGVGLSNEFAKRAGAKGIRAYGMSETVQMTIATDIYRDWPTDCLGRPTLGYETQLISPDTGAWCETDEPGELWVRGTRGVQLCLGYYNNVEADENAFTEDGWFKTGDILRVGADGLLYFMDRDKDRIKVGGENVSASEVERVILGVPGVMEVAVVARKHARLTEVPVAFVRRGADAPQENTLREAILSRCDQHLSKFKRPLSVHFLDEFPRALLNKVAKNQLREMAERLGSSPE